MRVTLLSIKNFKPSRKEVNETSLHDQTYCLIGFIYLYKITKIGHCQAFSFNFFTKKSIQHTVIIDIFHKMNPVI